MKKGRAVWHRSLAVLMIAGGAVLIVAAVVMLCGIEKAVLLTGIFGMGFGAIIALMTEE